MRTPPPSRRTVGAYTVLALLGVVALIGLSYLLRFDQPATSPLSPPADSAIDSLREEVPCELDEGREGEDREEAASEPSLSLVVTSGELYDCPQSWDDRLVRYTGEAIGARLSQGEGVWIQLNDDAYGQQGAPLPTHRDFRGGNAGIGVLFPPDLAAQVQMVGGPAVHGDVVEVVGRFERIDDATGEVAIIRAEQAVVLREGEFLERPAAPGRAAVAVVAFVGAVGITILERRRRI
ncbi:hypothetical protein [Euzebya tangerina]|uniref:hypothetical protein n=1 Tax=Euzebya tangerina TaxID=591198 RepID=UPI0013C2F18F|nr:hypothetical protein [Euzebya tangerina]